MSDEKLLESLQQLHHKLRTEIKEKYDRMLSFEDEIFDRWERANFLGFGSGSSIYSSSLVIGDVKIGSNTWVGPYTVLDGSGGLYIGDNCSISAGVQIYTHDTVEKRITGSDNKNLDSTTIGNNNYIGPMSMIRSGVNIGNNVIVGANSLVDKDLKSFAVAFGTPCKITGRIKIDVNNEMDIEYFKKYDYEKEINSLKTKVDELEALISKIQEKSND